MKNRNTKKKRIHTKTQLQTSDSSVLIQIIYVEDFKREKYAELCNNCKKTINYKYWSSS